MLWSRPAGPPHVYRVIELLDPSGKKRKFSLQEIPEERYDEAISHMCSIFSRDEAMCSALNVISDPPSMDLGRELWGLTLSQGISVGAFEILEDVAEPVLAGLNMLVYTDEEVDKVVESVEAGESQMGKLILFSMETSGPMDPRKLCNVDRYLGAFGLSIDPKFRRLGLGQQLLELRDEIGKRYDIEYTSTVFTSQASQRLAAKVGFETDLERAYDEAVQEDGTPIFPKLKGKSCKVMRKRIGRMNE